MDKFYCSITADCPFAPGEEGYTRTLMPNKNGMIMFYSKKRGLFIPYRFIEFHPPKEKEKTDG